MRVKICGVTNRADALLCAEAGADMLGLNFYPPSPRYLPPEQAHALAAGLRAALGAACPLLVGVFVNARAAEIAQIMELVGLDAAQLSGDERAEVLAVLNGRGLKAIRPRSHDEALTLARQYLAHSPADERLPDLLVDAYHPDLYGGTGEQPSTEAARAVCALASRMMLAGGLTPDNVVERVRAIQPWGVDVAGGVERAPGIKDAAKVRAFVDAARAAVLARRIV